MYRLKYCVTKMNDTFMYCIAKVSIQPIYHDTIQNPSVIHWENGKKNHAPPDNAFDSHLQSHFCIIFQGFYFLILKLFHSNSNQNPLQDSNCMD